MTTGNTERPITFDELTSFVQTILERAGLPAEDAALVAEVLATADVRGVHSHGVMRLPWYVANIEAGAVKARPTMRRIRQQGNTGLLDGDSAMGQLVGCRAMEWAIELARGGGVGIVGVRQSNHFGTCAYFAEMAAREGLIGVVMTNGYPNMAPWGGKKKMLGNHPFAVAIPAGEEPPVVLDISSSVVAQGRIALAAQKGESIPEGWGMDLEGRPTCDAKVAAGGLLMPLGAHKGYGLSLVIGILCTLLTGAQLGWEFVDKPSASPGLGVNIGHLMLALDVENFVPLAEFRSSMDVLVRAIRECPRVDGVDQIYVPGEIEFRREQDYMTEGIPIAGAVMRQLNDLAARLSVASPWKE